ncbi:MAG TPA: hypothetical protein VN842_00755 [Thermoplasmata archaeon]|nr:hypothetical protein [Thermoplasmata archaeon]
MDDEGEAVVSSGGPPPPEGAARVPPATWVGVAVIGVALFLLGIWVPAWRGVPGEGSLNLLAAAAGGVLFIVGVTYAWQGHRRTRSPAVAEFPGVEIFTPPTLGEGRSTEPTPAEEWR